jgi:hypothetical protein
MPDWLARHMPEGWSNGEIALAAAGLTVGTAVVSIVICALVAVRIPASYFVGDHAPPMWADHHPFIRWPLHVLKNLFGVFMVALGIVLSLPGVPGQGVLTILMGAMLLDFPGKRKAERWLLRRRGVLTGLNKVRKRYGRAPLILEAADGNAAGGGEIPKMP